MKKIYKLNLLIVLFFAFLVASCEEWTEVETKDFFENTKTEEYYAKLRAYKKTDHAISFGWYSKWFCNGPIGVNYLMGLPDSLDVVSMWGGSTPSSEAHIKDRDEVRRLKGTRLVDVILLGGIDKEKFKWSDADNGESAVREYARSLVKALEDNCLDGLDLDYEPHYGAKGNLVQSMERMFFLVDELSKYLGPKSGTGRLLIVDGEPQAMPKKTGDMFDYFVVQAYKCHSDRDLDYRLSRTIRNFDGILTPEEVTQKYVVTETFESGGIKGYTDRDGKQYEWSLQGMYNWKPTTGVRIGGFGTYKMENVFMCTATPWQLYREGIQTLNPSK